MYKDEYGGPGTTDELLQKAVDSWCSVAEAIPSVRIRRCRHDERIGAPRGRYGEEKDYDYGTGTGRGGAVTGHFTQVQQHRCRSVPVQRHWHRRVGNTECACAR